MKKIALLLCLCLLLTSCGNSSSNESESPSADSSSVVYEDVKVKDIVFPASSKLVVDEWSDTEYKLIYNGELCIHVKMHDVSSSSDSFVTDYFKSGREAKELFALLKLHDNSEHPGENLTVDNDYPKSGFLISKFSQDDRTAYYATQVINKTYYKICLEDDTYDRQSYNKITDKEISDYYDIFYDIVDSIKPA